MTILESAKKIRKMVDGGLDILSDEAIEKMMKELSDENHIEEPKDFSDVLS